MTPADFKREIKAAVKAYEKYCIVVDMPTSKDAEANILNLIERAIKQYCQPSRNRTASLSFNRLITVQLSDNPDGPLPRCTIYFNLHSAYVEESKKMEKEKAKTK